MALKSIVARKALKTTAKHTAHGTASKLKRERVRTTTLLGLGAAIGAAAVWLLGRLSGSGSETAYPSSRTAAPSS